MKTAFVLGGGGARGAYEIGVWQALREMDIEPDIVTGSSVGAINGAVVVQNSFDTAVKLWEEITTPMVVDIGKPRNKGSQLKRLLSKYLNEDKIRKRGIDFGLVALEVPSIQSRHFYLEDIPKGKLLDYIVASASFFPAIRMADIDDTKYVDGGYLDNLPVGMALKKGAKKIIAVDLETSGIVQKEPLKEAEDLTLIRCEWELGEIMVFDGKSSSKKIRLGYLDTLKAFNFFDGSYFAFSKSCLGKRTLKNAEMAGKIFRLNPEIIYTKDTYIKALSESIANYRQTTHEELARFQESIKNRKPEKEKMINLLRKLNEKTITLAIADQLKSNPNSKESLLARPISLLFKEESQAADYIVKHQLL